jgi:hypothetical protein
VRERLQWLTQAGAWLDMHVQAYMIDVDGPPSAASQRQMDAQDMAGSEMMCSQEMQAFFAPNMHFPGDADAEAGSEARPSQAAALTSHTRRVFRAVECHFRMT